ncbi:hypothetical protein [Altibacter sp.]|uniref:hypothetical protein n=1 Tax=Altibacter sp. TaxID=2024823 RepID=UPI000C8E1EB5|nr:hypothetical protein [Altibacter sp.]MAP53651.1 hypothetical protein [Altibacter sp.]
MKKTTHVLHTAKIANNCPECFATNGLEFTFSQEITETKWYHKADKTITESLFCHTCNTNVYPVRWNDDIERVYEYHQKLVVPHTTGTHLTSLAYIFLLVGIVLVAAVVYFLIR